MLERAEIRELHEAARQLAGRSRNIILDRMAGAFAVRRKADATFVTDVDIAVEEALRAEIERRFPEHGVMGEELPRRGSASDFEWVIDPIDGTLNFRSGIPLFGTIIALMHRGAPVVGVIDHPCLDICTSAGRGIGAYRNGQRAVTISDLPADAPVEEELLAVGGREQFVREGLGDFLDRIFRENPYTRTYNDCFGHTLAVNGSVAAMADFSVRVWDVAATVVLIAEAGGRLEWCNPGGAGLIPDGFNNVVFGKPRAVDWLLRQFAAYREERT